MSTQPPIVAVIGAPTLVPRLVTALKEKGYHDPIVPDDTELQHEPSMRKFLSYASPDVLVIAQDRVKAESASMVQALLTGIFAFQCSMGLAKVVLLTGVWPDPEFWTLVNIGQVMMKEGKITLGWYLKHPKSPAMLDWAEESVLAMRELLQAQEANQKSAQGQDQKEQVRNEVVSQ